MNEKFFVPTKIFIGKGCIYDNGSILKEIGTKAIIVTGKKSAKINGSEADVVKTLKENNIDYYIFDNIESNPSIQVVREAAAAAKNEKVDFVIGIGGGSPMDAAKAIAVLTANNIDDTQLFAGKYEKAVLPIVAIPTTAGTGSEVTPYSVLTDDSIQSKNSIVCEKIFPVVTFLDASYTEKLPLSVTINTAIDAFSHAAEGYLAKKSSTISDVFAKESINILGQCLKTLKVDSIGFEIREQLLYASMLAGIVITHTGTTALHAMGYPLTYFKGVDHGRANGLLMYEYLKFISLENKKKVDEVVNLLSLSSIDELKILIDELLGKKEAITSGEIEKFSSISINAGNIVNTLGSPQKADLKNILTKSFYN